MLQLNRKTAGRRKFCLFQVDPNCFVLEVENENGERREAAFGDQAKATDAGDFFIQGNADPRKDWLTAINR